MLNPTKSLKYFTRAQAAKLLGLTICELEELNRTRTGPSYFGMGEYIAFREDHIKEWAIKNVHAPAFWFNRFENPDPRTVQRMYLYYTGKYFKLKPYYTSQLILEMGNCSPPIF